MEIYRFLSVVDELRKLGVPESESLDELISIGLGENGHPLGFWKRESPAELRKKSKQQNDGTFGLEPYMRCHQIAIEKWLKGLITREEKFKVCGDGN